MDLYKKLTKTSRKSFRRWSSLTKIGMKCSRMLFMVTVHQYVLRPEQLLSPLRTSPDDGFLLQFILLTSDSGQLIIRYPQQSSNYRKRASSALQEFQVAA